MCDSDNIELLMVECDVILCYITAGTAYGAVANYVLKII